MEEGKRYKWTAAGTKLLVSIWSNDQIQSQMRASSRKVAIWRSIGRYMSGKGFAVSGPQCSVRIKNMTRAYEEAIRTGNPSAFQPYFHVFHTVISETKRARKERASYGKALKSEPTMLEIDSDDLQQDSEMEVLEEEEEEIIDEAQSAKLEMITHTENVEETTNSEAPYAATIKSVIDESLAAHTQLIRQLISESTNSIERLLVREREHLLEQVLAVLADDKDSRVQIERRIEKLESLTPSVPRLTYMGRENI